ncbi:MAG: purine-nucleoside phosphorylase [Gemmatimonadales bacterium]|nr:purine-nucleoside phosphorylase [Gemmatimonadales bacterium]
MIASSADTVTAAIGGRKPRIAIVLGSGLGPLADRIESAVRVPYGDIPGFHVPTVQGHQGELVVGTLAGVHVIAQSGRFHMYEGHSAGDAVLPIRVFAALGVETLIVTNAAGGIRQSFRPGTLMLISDHLNLTGRNPLEGPVLEGETRFPDMSVPYDAGLRATARAVAAERGITLDEGTYAALLGPTYETPAEVRMLERLGADAVGMSTVPEVIVARARSMRCLGISTITNAAAGTSSALLSHADVMDVARDVGAQLADLVSGVISAMTPSS